MYTLRQVREQMVELALSETTREWVQVTGEDLHDALRKGAEKLNVPLDFLEYEVLRKGDRGIFGLGRSSWVLRVTQLPDQALKDKNLAEEVDTDAFSLRLRNSRAFLRVTKRKNEPLPDVSEVLTVLRKRTSKEISSPNIIERIIRKASGKYESVMEIANNPQNNVSIECMIINDGLNAVIMLSPPGVDGHDVTAADISSALHLAGVRYGINDESIKKIVEYPRYDVPIQVASGSPAVNEEDASVEYLYTTFSETQLNNLESERDFKEIGNIPNVRAGDVIARKKPPSRGREGVLVTGEIFLPEKGRDIDIRVGANVELSSDGLSAIALKDGMVRLKSGILTIEPIYYVNGDVNMKVGNIHFVGSVVIKGDVLDGFIVEAEGDIQVMGSVGRATLLSKGNIYLQRGMAGGGEGKIVAQGNVWARFLENCQVEVREHLLVSDGIVNSSVEVSKSLLCRGKRASIVGGVIYAGEFVDVKSMGTLSGVKTSVGVGIPPRLRIQELTLKRAETKVLSDQRNLEQQIAVLEHRSQMGQMGKGKEEEPGGLDKELTESRGERAANILRLEELQTEMNAVQEEMEEYVSKGMVSVLRQVFPGVVITVGSAQLPVQQEYSGVSFVYDKGMVKIQKYTETKIAIPRPV